MMIKPKLTRLALLSVFWYLIYFNLHIPIQNSLKNNTLDFEDVKNLHQKWLFTTSRDILMFDLEEYCERQIIFAPSYKSLSIEYNSHPTNQSLKVNFLDLVRVKDKCERGFTKEDLLYASEYGLRNSLLGLTKNLSERSSNGLSFAEATVVEEKDLYEVLSLLITYDNHNRSTTYSIVEKYDAIYGVDEMTLINALYDYKLLKLESKLATAGVLANLSYLLYFILQPLYFLLRLMILFVTQDTGKYAAAAIARWNTNFHIEITTDASSSEDISTESEDEDIDGQSSLDNGEAGPPSKTSLAIVPFHVIHKRSSGNVNEMFDTINTQEESTKTTQSKSPETISPIYSEQAFVGDPIVTSSIGKGTHNDTSLDETSRASVDKKKRRVQFDLSAD
ncbi:MAG: hypothetical protein EXX96DRAFT_535110 [Benjaminiella poitrasii]|nr:MAG: hypothetical protein EXX96DRAFT_535110 [Benjaminiella poitrasii]